MRQVRPDAQEHLDGLHRLERPHDAGNRPEDRAVLRLRRLRHEAPVARAPLLRKDRQQHPLEPLDGGGDERLLPEPAGVRQKEPRRKIVGAIEHEVEPANDRPGVSGRQPFRQRLDRAVGSQGTHRFDGPFDLGPADVGRAVDHLPIQVRQFHLLVVQDAQSPDAHGREVQDRRRPEAARPDHQRARPEEPALSLGPDAGKREVPLVADGLILAQARFVHRTLPGPARCPAPGRSMLPCTGAGPRGRWCLCPARS